MKASYTNTAYKNFNYLVGEVYSSQWGTNAKTQFKRDYYVEIRAQVPSGQNVWPALWIWGCNPSYEEIDFAEFNLSPITSTGFAINFHSSYGIPCGTNSDYPLEYADVHPENTNGSSIDLSGAYHIYGFECTSSYMKFYLDNQLLGTYAGGGGYTPINPNALILSLQMLSSYTPPCTTQQYTPSPVPSDLPKYFKIDYVRVYSKNNSAAYFAGMPGNLCSSATSTSTCGDNGRKIVSAYYPNATYSFSSPDGAFTLTQPGGYNNWEQCVTFVSGKTTNANHPISLSITFPDGHTETKSYNLYVASSTQVVPIKKKRLGTTCYWQIYVDPIPGVTSYDWKINSGSWETNQSSTYAGEFDPNTTITAAVRYTTACGQLTGSNTSITMGSSPPNCTWKLDSSYLTRGNLELMIYPNPVNNELSISLRNIQENNTLQILNIYGKVVEEIFLKGGEENLSFDLSDYPPGIYFVELNGTESRIIEKLIKD